MLLPWKKYFFVNTFFIEWFFFVNNLSILQEEGIGQGIIQQAAIWGDCYALGG